MISSGILPGTIQINNKGLPMVLGPDAETIGGYPRLGGVAKIDFDKPGQLCPGDTVRFKHISLEEAQNFFIIGRNGLIIYWMKKCKDNSRG